MGRNLSSNAWFRKLGLRQAPQFRFAGTTKDDWAQWKKQLPPTVKSTPGKMLGKTYLSPEIEAEWRENGLIKQRVVFDVENELIAPRPPLAEIGPYDTCFRVDSAMSCFGEVEKTYTAAGVRDRLVLDLFNGGHRWGG